VSSKSWKWRRVAGRGTKGRLNIDGRVVSFKLGSEAFMEDCHTSSGLQSNNRAELEAAGLFGRDPFTLPYLDSSSTSAVEQLSIAARFAISDPPRDEAARMIASLKRSGKSVWMLSGDNETTARAVGHVLGIDPSNVKLVFCHRRNPPSSRS
jgi:Cu+-exporting ATPase